MKGQLNLPQSNIPYQRGFTISRQNGMNAYHTKTTGLMPQQQFDTQHTLIALLLYKAYYILSQIELTNMDHANYVKKSSTWMQESSFPFSLKIRSCTLVTTRLSIIS